MVESRELRVLVLSSFPPGVGGGELQTLLQLKELQRLGCRVTVIDLCPRHQGPEREIYEGLEVIRLVTPRLPVIRSLWFHGKILRALLRQKEADVAHINNIGTALYSASPILALRRIPRVLVIWGSGMPGIGPFSSDFRFRLARVFARRAERIIGLSSRTVRYLVQQGFPEERVGFIPNGVDLGRFENEPERGAGTRPEGWPLENPVVVTIGRMVYEKGFPDLLQAWAILKSHGIHGHLVFVGDGLLRQDLERRVEELDLEESVTFAGERDDVIRCLRHSDVFVSSSISEGMSNAILEALGAGLPLVATDVGGASDILTDGVNGYLVPPASPEALAKKLEALLLDPEVRRAFGEESGNKARTSFSIQTVVRRYVELYRSLSDSC